MYKNLSENEVLKITHLLFFINKVFFSVGLMVPEQCCHSYSPQKEYEGSQRGKRV